MSLSHKPPAVPSQTPRGSQTHGLNLNVKTLELRRRTLVTPVITFSPSYKNFSQSSRFLMNSILLNVLIYCQFKNEIVLIYISSPQLRMKGQLDTILQEVSHGANSFLLAFLCSVTSRLAVSLSPVAFCASRYMYLYRGMFDSEVLLV